MTRHRIAGIALGCAVLVLAAGCQGAADHAHTSSSGEPAGTPAWSAPRAAPASDAQAELRDLRAQLNQARMERDAALAQVRELEAQLNASAAPSPHPRPTVTGAASVRATQVFKTLTTASQSP
jgi:hypothetical protein